MMAAFNQLKASREAMLRNPNSLRFIGGKLPSGTVLFGGMVKPGEKITFSGALQGSRAPGGGFAMLHISSSKGSRDWPTDILEETDQGGGVWNPVRMNGITRSQFPLSNQSVKFTITLTGKSSEGDNASPEFILGTILLAGPPDQTSFAKLEQQFRAVTAPIRNVQSTMGYNWTSGQTSFMANIMQPNEQVLHSLPLSGSDNLVLVSNDSGGSMISKSIAVSPDHSISVPNFSGREQLVAVTTMSK